MERKRVLVGEKVDDYSIHMEEEKKPDPKRRNIFSHYREIGNRINEEKEELADLQSGKFLDIMNEVENIHQHVKEPREQVADAEAFLGLARTLVASIKTNTNGGVTPAEFVSCLITQFEHKNTTKELLAKSHSSISWNTIGSCVSPIFKNGKGCMTMIGPMNNKLKHRKVYARRAKRSMSRKARPRKIENAAEEKEKDTVKNTEAMYGILRKARRVKVENLMLNRHSFAQTVENLFALSFLVKDGRVVIEVDENGSHFAVPINGPSAEDIKSGEVTYHHFIFRFDFNDWKVMKTVVAEGEEVMAQRPVFAEAETEAEVIPSDAELTCTTLSVKKHSRNFLTNWLN
ncbi:hypothetical protein ACS0TY_025142 [Phlomoides rotata]